MLEESLEVARKSRRQVIEGEGNVFGLSPFFGATKDPGHGPPSAFLLEPDPGVVVAPHFHTVDQFQLFISGSGEFGRRRFAAPFLVFTDAYTTYGPINVPDSGKCQFFTLRFEHGTGQLYMPGSRELKTHRSGRSDVILNGPEVPDSLRVGETRTLTRADDGLAVFLSKAGPGETIEWPSKDFGRGQYWVALDGALDSGAGKAASIIFVGPDDDRNISAEVAGATVLIMQFPDRMALN